MPNERQERIKSEVDRHMRIVDNLWNEFDRVAVLPEDDFEDGAVIQFEKTFTSGTYQYAAIKAKGLWYTTGPLSPKAYTWDRLIDFIGSNTIWFVTEYEELT